MRPLVLLWRVVSRKKPEEHPIYREFKQTILKKKVYVILERISQWKPCQGLRTQLKRSMG